jgi:hypothetical protein
MKRTIFNKAKSLALEYPWSLETNAKPIGSFWGTIRTKHLLNLGFIRARKLFKDEAYPFPYQFETDAADIVTNCFSLLSSPQAADSTKLEKYMVEGLVNKYRQGFINLEKTDRVPSYVLHSKPKVRLNSMHFAYGPFPPPKDYIGQEWFDFITILLPKEDAHFESHPRQNQLLEQAEGQGCHVRIDTTIEMDIEFVLSNTQSLPLLRDRRQFLDISFTSPHFTPWDTIFDLQPDGTWKLNWDWKIANINTQYI